jgi:hypothetical protein
MFGLFEPVKSWTARRGQSSRVNARELAAESVDPAENPAATSWTVPTGAWRIGASPGVGLNPAATDRESLGDFMKTKRQKIYPVTPWVMAGFAGSVYFGLKSFEHMQRFFSAPPGQVVLPEIASWGWHRHARRAFAKAPQWVRQHESKLLLSNSNWVPHR